MLSQIRFGCQFAIKHYVMLQRSAFAVGVLSDGWFGRQLGLSTQKIDKCNKKINNMFNFCKVAFNFCNTGRCVNFLEPYNFLFFSFFSRYREN